MNSRDPPISSQLQLFSSVQGTTVPSFYVSAVDPNSGPHSFAVRAASYPGAVSQPLDSFLSQQRLYWRGCVRDPSFETAPQRCPLHLVKPHVPVQREMLSEKLREAFHIPSDTRTCGGWSKCILREILSIDVCPRARRDRIQGKEVAFLRFPPATLSLTHTHTLLSFHSILNSALTPAVCRYLLPSTQELSLVAGCESCPLSWDRHLKGPLLFRYSAVTALQSGFPCHSQEGKDQH